MVKLLSFFKRPGEENFLGGKKCTGNWDLTHYPKKPNFPAKGGYAWIIGHCQNCGCDIWTTDDPQWKKTINLCEPCYLLTFRGYTRRAAYPERN